MAYAYVGGAENSDGSGSAVGTISVTYTSTLHNLLRVIVSRTANVTIAMTDGGVGNTFTAEQSDIGTAGNQLMRTYYCKDCKAGSTTFLATFGANTQYPVIRVEEYSGLDVTAPFIAAAGAENVAPGTVANAISSGNINVSSAPAMLVGTTLTEDVSVGNVVTDTAFTRRTQVFSFFGYPAGGIGDRRLTATNAAIPALFSDTTSGGTNNYIAIVAAYKETATAQSADIVAGLDTYGWQDPDPPVQTAMRRGTVAINFTGAIYQRLNRTQIFTEQTIIQL